jgi:hypothetical protein
MGTIFISYAREDKDRASLLAEQCESRGADPWWDRELSSGERYIESILRQVAQADHFVLLLSESSVKSSWVAFEVGAARAREFTLGRDFLKIAKLDDCEIPGFLGERNATLWIDNHDGMVTLLRSLNLPEDIDYKPPAGAPDRSLVVFRAGGQWMELIISDRGMECVLVDVGEQRSRLQWQISRDNVVRCLEHECIKVEPVRADRSWSLFSLGSSGRWRWSPTLFTRGDDSTPENNFKHELQEHLASIHDF